MQSIFVAFCSFYKPECVFDSFANKRWIVRPEGNQQGFEALSHENSLRSNALLNCFIFVEVCF